LGKLAFLFPGQGSQYVGMGRDLAEGFDVAGSVFAEADEVLGWQISRLCFEGPEEDLRLTANTQPAILTTSVAALRVLEQHGLKPDFVGGHSLGEYTALVAAGVLEFPDALRLTRLRGELMEKAFPAGMGGMIAILGLSLADVDEVCAKASFHGIVEPANINCPGQIVLAGDANGLEQAMALAKEAGAKKVVRLAVSGPFHCRLMQPAAEALSEAIHSISFKPPECPVVANVTASITSSVAEIRENLIKQVYNPVRWEESIKTLMANGVGTVVEVGPGSVLAGLVKKIHRDLTVWSAGDAEGLQKVIAVLKGGA